MFASTGRGFSFWEPDRRPKQLRGSRDGPRVSLQEGISLCLSLSLSLSLFLSLSLSLYIYIYIYEYYIYNICIYIQILLVVALLKYTGSVRLVSVPDFSNIHRFGVFFLPLVARLAQLPYSGMAEGRHVNRTELLYIYIYTHTYIYIYIYIYTDTSLSIYIYRERCTHIYIYVFIVCVYVCM